MFFKTFIANRHRRYHRIGMKLKLNEIKQATYHLLKDKDAVCYHYSGRFWMIEYWDGKQWVKFLN